MKHLIELSKLVRANKFRYHSLLGGSNDKAEQLYRLIRDEGDIDPSKVKACLFEGKNNKSNLLWRTKNKLKDRLINSILVLQYDDANFYKSAFIKANKELAVCKTLRVEGKRKTFGWLAEKLIKKSIRLHFTEIVYNLAKELRFQYSAIDPNSRKATKYQEILEIYRDHLETEDEIELLYCEFILMIQKSKNFSDRQRREAGRLVLKAADLLEKRKTYWTVMQAVNMEALYYQMLNQHHKTAQACKKALNIFEQLPYPVPVTAEFFFTFDMIPGQILTKQFRDASSNLNRCLKLHPPGHLNWARAKRMQVICLFHQQKYRDVLRITQEMKKYPQEYISIESWTIYRAYASILTGQSLRLGKFLNEVPKFSRDTRGMNINILIIQIVEYIRRGQYEEVIDRTEALKLYIYRHLQEQDTLRSNTFIKMLISLEKGHFTPLTISKYARPYLKILEKNPLDLSKQDFEVEIVPYEHLWQFIIDMLKR